MPLVRQETVASAGVHSYGINMAKAPVPQRRYAAELCTVSFGKNEAKFIFAQTGLGDDSLDSALVIRMSPVALTQFAQSLHDMTSPTIAEICNLTNIVPEEISEIKSKPQQMANMVANICSVAVAGHETCLDFYHASAFATKKSESTDELEVEPVVRVDLRTALFVPLIACIFSIESEILTRLTGEMA